MIPGRSRASSVLKQGFQMLKEDFGKLVKGDRVLIGPAHHPLAFCRLLTVVEHRGFEILFREVLPSSECVVVFDIVSAEVARMVRLPNLVKLVADITELNEIARAAVVALADNEHFEELKSRYERCVNGFENVRIALPE